ncbi:MAG: hypothetical protein K2K44_12680 [Oscillospiraceae bacterium]|nr:hypothetical protein [Oscillospiraceae bacterium]
MKIDFYDLFSLHTPNDFPEAGEDNYITAAVKSRVMENILASRSKSVRISKIGRAFLAAAAAVVVLAMGTLAASALGLIDLEKIFGGIFDSGTEHLAGITAVPQDVVITGDDRLSFRVLGIGGTENEAFGAIEIKRNDGGVFPEYIHSDACSVFNGIGESFVSNELEIIDETTAIYYFRHIADNIITDNNLVGSICTFKISQIVDSTEHKENRACVYYLGENKNIILEGDWSVTFTMDYNAEERSISVNEPYYEKSIISSVITEVKLSAISLNVHIEELYGSFSNAQYYAVIKLDSGEELTAELHTAIRYGEGSKTAVSYYPFDKPIDIDSVESITIGNVVITVK